jgi:hypothetical protein
MEDIEFSDDFCRFIQSAIPAVDAAELLLVFYRKPEDAITVEEAMAKLGPGIGAGTRHDIWSSSTAAAS